jgi:hypothetical protein
VEFRCGFKDGTGAVVPLSSTDQGDEVEKEFEDTAPFGRVSLAAQVKDVGVSAKPKLA